MKTDYYTRKTLRQKQLLLYRIQEVINSPAPTDPKIESIMALINIYNEKSVATFLE